MRKCLNSGFLVNDLKAGMYCKLNEYMKILIRLRTRPKVTSDFVVVNIFKHFLDRNHWANQSQISCRSCKFHVNFLGMGKQ